ncbi:tripartite tricarboxylate transporter TctB family protein [Celeribacter sp. ULVN23_4]
MYDRIAGSALLVFALLLGFWIIPNNTQTAGYGLQPDLLPLISSMGIGLFSLPMIFSGKLKAVEGGQDILPLAVSFVILVASIALMSWAHFIVGGIALTSGFLALARERRIIWIAAAIIVPIGIWLLFSVALQRELF